MKVHKLKTTPHYFEDIWRGHKTFEVRFNDRDFKEGDQLLLKEYHSDSNIPYRRGILCKVTYILNHPDYVKKGYVILQIYILNKYSALEMKKTI